MKHSSSTDFHSMKFHDMSPCAYMGHMNDKVPYPNNLLKLRKASELTQKDIAKVWGCEPPLVSRIENGLVGITRTKIKQLTEKFGWTASQLLENVEADLKIPVVGYVGAGIVYAIDDHAIGAGLDEVDCPRGFEGLDIVAVRVRGDSMRPMLRDGWLLFYRRSQEGVSADCIGEVCIVKMLGGEVMVREILKGSKTGYFHLMAHNGEPLMDVRLEWAAKVIDIRPS